MSKELELGMRIGTILRGALSKARAFPKAKRGNVAMIFGLSLIPLALAAVVLLCGLFMWQEQARENARQQARLAQLTLERAEVAHQAENALGLVGSMLLTAGNDSGQIISDRTVPPLRSSFETAKTKISQYIDL